MMTRFRYTFQAFQKDHFWLPSAIMALFIIITVFIPETERYNTARAFLGFVLPLISGGLSAYGFLDDSALELHFTTKRSAWQMILERLGIVMVVIIATSLVFQVIVELMGISIAPLGGILQRQLIWLVPCLTLAVLGGAASLLAKSSSGGFALVGGIWIFQLLARGWFAEKPILRNVLLFFGAMAPLSKERVYNQITLVFISAVLIAATYSLLKKQERYV